MNGLESLDYFGRWLALLANLFVATVCLRVYLKNRISPLLILALAGVVSALALLIDVLLLRSASTGAAFTTAFFITLILWLVNVFLYASGVCLLVTRHLKRRDGVSGREPS